MALAVLFDVKERQIFHMLVQNVIINITMASGLTCGNVFCTKHFLWHSSIWFPAVTLAIGSFGQLIQVTVSSYWSIQQSTQHWCSLNTSQEEMILCSPGSYWRLHAWHHSQTGQVLGLNPISAVRPGTFQLPF